MSDQDTVTQQSQQSGDDWFKQNAPGAVSPTDPGNLLPVAPTPAPASGPHAGAKHPAQQPAPTATAASTPASAGANPDDWFKQNAPQAAPATSTAPTSMFPGAYQSGNMYPGAPVEATAHKDISGENVMNDLARGGNSFAAHDIPNPFAIAHDAVMHPGKAVVGLAASTPPGQAFEGIKNSVAGYEAYEKARSSGAGVLDSLKAASDTMKSRDAVAQQVQQRADEFKKDPGAANARALFDVLGLLVTGTGTGEAPSAGVAGEPVAIGDAVADAATSVKNAAKSTVDATKNVVKQVAQGEKIAQPGAVQTLRTGAQASATDAGVAAEGATAPGQGIRTFMDKSIAATAKAERATYDAVNKAAGMDLKTAYDNESVLKDKLSDPTIDPDTEARLELKLKNVQDTIQEGEASAVKNNVSPKTLNEAKAMTQQRYAMQDAKQKLFNNENVVNGNVKHGVEESINVNNAIKQVEAMDKPSKYAPEGTPTRLEQAFGKEGAFKLKQGLYDAQKAGQSAISKQQMLSKILKYTGIGTGVVGGAYELLK
jgi:hypothetical protein